MEHENTKYIKIIRGGKLSEKLQLFVRAQGVKISRGKKRSQRSSCKREMAGNLKFMKIIIILYTSKGLV